MNKKILIIFGIILIIVILLIIIRKNNSENSKNNTFIKQEKNVEYEYDEETDEYILYDKDGKEYRTEDETILEILKQDPDYDLTILQRYNNENKENEIE